MFKSIINIIIVIITEKSVSSRLNFESIFSSSFNSFLSPLFLFGLLSFLSLQTGAEMVTSLASIHLSRLVL